MGRQMADPLFGRDDERREEAPALKPWRAPRFMVSDMNATQNNPAASGGSDGSFENQS